MGWDWVGMVIIRRRQSKSTFGANKIDNNKAFHAHMIFGGVCEKSGILEFLVSCQPRGGGCQVSVQHFPNYFKVESTKD